MPLVITESSDKVFKQPILQWSADLKEFVLVQTYRFTWTRNGLSKRLTVYSGRNTDKASVPRIFWPIFRPDGDIEGPALLHDYLCDLIQHHIPFPPGGYQTYNRLADVWEDDPTPWTGAQAHDLFEYACIATKKISPLKAAIAKWAIKLYPVNWFKGL